MHCLNRFRACIAMLFQNWVEEVVSVLVFMFVILAIVCYINSVLVRVQVIVVIVVVMRRFFRVIRINLVSFFVVIT